MADVMMELNGKQKRVPADKVAYFQGKGARIVAAHTDAPADAAGHSEAGEPPAEAKQDAPGALARFGRAHIDGAKALLTGAGVGAAMGKDDDLAGTAAALGAATQQDMDAGNPMVALRRVLGTAAPAFVPGLGIAGEVASRAEQYLADKAAPGARETATQGQRAKVAKSFEESPMLTGAGLLGGGALNAAVTGGALANTAVQGGAKSLAASGFAPGFVTGFEGKDDGNLQERVASGLGAGAVGALGSVAAPMVLRAAGSGLEKLGNMRIGATAPKAPGTGPGARVLRGIKNLAADPDAVLAAAPQWSGGPALKTARDVWKRGAPPTSAPGMAGDATLADDLAQGFNPGGKSLNASGVIEEAAGASDDAALAALKAKMAAEDAPLVLRKKITPVGPEDIVDDVAPRAAPPAEVTPPRQLTPVEQAAAEARLPTRRPVKMSAEEAAAAAAAKAAARDADVDAVASALRQGRAPDLEGADGDPFVTPPAREATAVQRGKTPRPAPMPEVMPDDFVDEGVSVLRQIPGRRAAPQLEAGPERLALEGRGDVPALPARPVQRQLNAPPPVLRQRKPDAPRKLQGPPDTFQGAAEATPEEIAASMARMQSSRVMPDVEPARMPLLPPDLLEAQLARTGGDREKALAAAHGQLSKEFRRTDPELARGRQRSAVNFDDASPGPAPIATPKGRNRSAAPFQGEDWAPREAAAPAAIVDDVAAPGDRVDFWRKKGDELRERPYPHGKFDEAAERANQRPPAAPFQDPDAEMSAAVDAADTATRAAEKAKTPEAYRAAAQANSDAAQAAWNRGDKVSQRAYDQTKTSLEYKAKLTAERIAADESAARVAAREATEAARIANRTPAQVARVRASEAADVIGTPQGNTPENARRAAQMHMEAAEIADSEQSRRYLMQNAAELERHAAALEAKASAPPAILRPKKKATR